MDIKVSRKENRYLPNGEVAEELQSGIFDLYPVFADAGELAISDIEVIDDPNAELIDRAVWAAIKQRGADPTDPTDGNQWAETIIGELLVPVLVEQVKQAVLQEGPGVTAQWDTVTLEDGRSVVNLVVRVAS